MGRLNVELAFTANTSQAANQLKNLKTQLTQLAQTTNFDMAGKKMTQGLWEAQQAAAQLKTQLDAATNVNTGKLNLTKFNQQLKAGNTSLTTYREQFAKLGPQGTQAFSQLTTSIMQANSSLGTGSKLLVNFTQTLANVAKYQISNAIYRGVTSTLSSAYQYAQDLNESLNKIRIVTGQSVEEMDKFADRANKAAQALSTTTNEYAKASLIFYQQGLGDKQVEERTKTVIKMANVTGQSADKVSSQMTAIWNNFYDGSKSLEHYADVITALGAATASSSEEIAQGLQKFAAVADTVGLSYDYATTALTTVVAQTRQSADVVGTAFKTLFSRIQDLKLGDTLDDGTTLGNYSKALKTVGVDIQTVTGDIKDMDVILNELGGKWENLSQATKIATAEAVAGRRQYTQFIALMDNWDTFQQNLSTAQNSDNSLGDQANIYAESWEAAQKRVKAAAEDIYHSLLDDKFFISLTNSFSEVLKSIQDMIKGMGGLKGLLPAVAAVLFQIAGPKIASGLSNIGMTVTGMLPAFKTMASTFRSTEGSFKDKFSAMQAGPTSVADRRDREMKEYAASEQKQMISSVSKTAGQVEADGLQRKLNLQNQLVAASGKLNEQQQAEIQILMDSYDKYHEKTMEQQKQVDLKREELELMKKESMERVSTQSEISKGFAGPKGELQKYATLQGGVNAFDESGVKYTQGGALSISKDNGAKLENLFNDSRTTEALSSAGFDMTKLSKLKNTSHQIAEYGQDMNNSDNQEALNELREALEYINTGIRNRAIRVREIMQGDMVAAGGTEEGADVFLDKIGQGQTKFSNIEAEDAGVSLNKFGEVSGLSNVGANYETLATASFISPEEITSSKEAFDQYIESLLQASEGNDELKAAVEAVQADFEQGKDVTQQLKDIQDQATQAAVEYKEVNKDIIPPETIERVEEMREKSKELDAENKKVKDSVKEEENAYTGLQNRINAMTKTTKTVSQNMTSVMGGVTSLVGGINMLSSGISILTDKSKPLGKRLLSAFMMILPGVTMLTGSFSKLGKGFTGLSGNLGQYIAKKRVLKKLNNENLVQIGKELQARGLLSEQTDIEELASTKLGKEKIAETMASNGLTIQKGAETAALEINTAAEGAEAAANTANTATEGAEAAAAGTTAAAKGAESAAHVTNTATIIAEETAAWPLLLIALALAAALAAIVAIIYLISKANEEHEKAQRADNKALDEAKEGLEAWTEKANEAKEAWDSLTESFDKYKNLQENINSLVSGTDAYNKALNESNQLVLDLIEKYPTLAEYVTNVNGRLTLTEEGMKAAEQAAKDEYYDALEQKQGAARYAAHMGLNAVETKYIQGVDEDYEGVNQRYGVSSDAQTLRQFSSTTQNLLASGKGNDLSLAIAQFQEKNDATLLQELGISQDLLNKTSSLLKSSGKTVEDFVKDLKKQQSALNATYVAQGQAILEESVTYQNASDDDKSVISANIASELQAKRDDLMKNKSKDLGNLSSTDYSKKKRIGRAFLVQVMGQDPDKIQEDVQDKDLVGPTAAIDHIWGESFTVFTREKEGDEWESDGDNEYDFKNYVQATYDYEVDQQLSGTSNEDLVKEIKARSDKLKNTLGQIDFEMSDEGKKSVIASLTSNEPLDLEGLTEKDANALAQAVADHPELVNALAAAGGNHTAEEISEAINTIGQKKAESIKAANEALDVEKYGKESLAKLLTADFGEEEFKEYAKNFDEYGDAADQVAQANLKLQKQAEKTSKAYKDNYEALTANEEGTEAYITAEKKMVTAFNEVIKGAKLTASGVQNAADIYNKATGSNITKAELWQKAAEGDLEAITALRAATAEDMILELGLDDQTTQQLQSLVEDGNISESDLTQINSIISNNRTAAEGIYNIVEALGYVVDDSNTAADKTLEYVEEIEGRLEIDKDQLEGLSTAIKQERKKLNLDSRYHSTESAINSQTRAVSRLNTQLDKTYGASRLKAINNVIAANQNLISLYEKEKIEAQEAASTAKTSLLNQFSGLILDAEGYVTNYYEVLSRLGDDETQKQLFKDLVSDYENQLSKIQEIEDSILDTQDEIISKKFEKLTYEVEVNVQINTNEVTALDYTLSQIKDDWYKAAEAQSLVNQKMDVSLDNLNTYEGHINKLEELYAETGDQASYIEGLQTEYDNIYSTLTTLDSYAKEVREYYGNTLKTALSEIDKEITKIDDITKTLQHYQKVLNLTGDKNDWSKQLQVLQSLEYASTARIQNYQNILSELEREREQVIARRDSLEVGSDGYDQAVEDLELLDEKITSYNSKWEAEVENNLSILHSEAEAMIKDVYETARDQATNGLGFDGLKDEITHLKTMSGLWLDDVNKVYQTNKLINTATKEIEKTTNAASKSQLNGYIQQITQLQKRDKLSKVDLELAQKQYSILQARIALEEAQNVKTHVRLQRNAEGGYGYIYTADESKQIDLEQKLADAENAYYNYQTQVLQDSASSRLTLEENYWKDRQTILNKYQNGEYETDEAFYEALNILENRYYEQAMTYSHNYQTVLEFDHQLSETSWGKLYVKVDSTMNNMNSIIDSQSHSMIESLNKVRGKIGTEKFENETLTNALDAANTAIDTVNNTIGAATSEAERSGLIGKLANASDAVESFLKDFEDPDGFNGRLEKIAEKFQSIADAIQNIINTTSTIDITNVTSDNNDNDNDGTDTKTSTSFPYTYEKLNKDVAGRQWYRLTDSKGFTWTTTEDNLTFNVDTQTANIKDTSKAGTMLYDYQQYADTHNEQDLLKETTIAGKTNIYGTVMSQNAKSYLVFGKGKLNTNNNTTILKDKENKAQSYEGFHFDWLDGSRLIKYNKSGEAIVAPPGSTFQYDGYVSSNSEDMTISEIFYSNHHYFAITNKGTFKLNDLLKAAKINFDNYIGSYDTGGYTGSWDSSGKLAMLHQKELVLNAGETENFLSAINSLRLLTNKLNIDDFVSQLSDMANITGSLDLSKLAQPTTQNIEINASFPNATNQYEIQSAFEGLFNKVSQYANSLAFNN